MYIQWVLIIVNGGAHTVQQHQSYIVFQDICEVQTERQPDNPPSNSGTLARSPRNDRIITSTSHHSVHPNNCRSHVSPLVCSSACPVSPTVNKPINQPTCNISDQSVPFVHLSTSLSNCLSTWQLSSIRTDLSDLCTLMSRCIRQPVNQPIKLVVRQSVNISIHL